MSTADDVIGHIDHALYDFRVSDDAMRWTPEPAPPLPPRALLPSPFPARTAQVVMHIDFGPFQEAVKQAAARFAAAIAPMLAEIQKMGEAVKSLQDHEADQRRSATRTAYRARARRRTRSHR